MPAAPTVSDLATWLGQTIADDDARALLVVTAANGLVADAAPGSPSWGDDSWPEVARTIAIGAAARGWVNPTGAKRHQQGTGPFSDDKNWDAAGVLLTEEEEGKLAGLGLPDVGGVPGLSSVRVVAPAGTSPSMASWGPSQQFELDE